MSDEAKTPAKKRRFLASDYDYIANHIVEEMGRRETHKQRTHSEMLWREVDRQVHMEPLEKVDVNGNEDPDRTWESALELGDLSTASEILTADTIRLIFPSDRAWLSVHSDIQEDRLQARREVENRPPIDPEEIAKAQKYADSEMKALMTQQHKDFGFRDRIELSVKEANHHGSFVAEVNWTAIQQYSMGGVFKSQAAPVWEPHSMWNAYPEPGELGLNLIYEGSMILKTAKPLDWVKRQTTFINQKKFEDKVTDKNAPVELLTYYGDITVRRKGEDVFLPNMKIIIARESKIVLFAQPNEHVKIIYGGYDRVDVRDCYHMSPIIKQSPNHKILTIIANKFIDNIDLKLDPTIIYDGNDPQLVAQGGPKIGPGRQYPAKGGVANFKQIDVGDPSWATNAITYFDQKTQQGTGVSAPRTGATRQADRITATQIEEEAAGSELRTVDFVNKMERGILAFLYIQHELNRKKLSKYKFYNPEPGMPDFVTLSASDLPENVHFDVVGSKGLLTERRRSRATSEVTAFLLSNPLTQDIPDLIENARQMYADAGNKNPELLMNVGDENDRIQKAVQAAIQQFQQQIEELNETVRKQGQDLVKKDMELTNARDQLQLRNERAEGTESALRDQIRIMKGTQNMQEQFLTNMGKIQDEQQALEDTRDEIEQLTNQSGSDASSGEPAASQPSNVVELHKHDIPQPYRIVRDENGDMEYVVPVTKAEIVSGEQ